MASEPLVDARDGLLVGHPVPEFTFHAVQLRQLMTALSDDQLEQKGLMVTAPDDLSNRQGRVKWLVERPANDMWLRDPKASGKLISSEDYFSSSQANFFPSRTATLPPAWEEELIARIAELRDVAGDEGLPFVEASAEAARTFVRRIDGSSRPAAFLIGNGNVRLVWSVDNGEHVGLQFRADGTVQYIIFKSRRGQISEIMGVEAASHVRELLHELRMMHVLRA